VNASFPDATVSTTHGLTLTQISVIIRAPNKIPTWPRWAQWRAARGARRKAYQPCQIRRRRATRRGDASPPSPFPRCRSGSLGEGSQGLRRGTGCGGSGPAPALLLLGVSLPADTPSSSRLGAARWRTQRDHVSMMLGTLSPRAKRELDHVPEEIFRKLDAEIWALRQNPRPFGCIKLKGPIHRIRLGRWRVIYAVFDRDQLVIILKVAQRTEQT